jgi:hypothetical protein
MRKLRSFKVLNFAKKISLIFVVLSSSNVLFAGDISGAFGLKFGDSCDDCKPYWYVYTDSRDPFIISFFDRKNHLKKPPPKPHKIFQNYGAVVDDLDNNKIYKIYAIGTLTEKKASIDNCFRIAKSIKTTISKKYKNIKFLYSKGTSGFTGYYRGIEKGYKSAAIYIDCMGYGPNGPKKSRIALIYTDIDKWNEINNRDRNEERKRAEFMVKKLKREEQERKDKIESKKREIEAKREEERQSKFENSIMDSL